MLFHDHHTSREDLNQRFKKKGFKKMVSLEAKQDWSSSPLV